MSKSDLEETLFYQIKVAGLPEPAREYRFDDRRKWRFDFAWRGLMLAAEVQGGTWNGGAHGRGVGIKRDYEKLNTAQLHGWMVLQFDTNQVKDGTALSVIEQAIQQLEAE